MAKLVKARPPGWAYRLLSLALTLFWALHALRHGRKHRHAGYASMRLFGFEREGGPSRVWVHASSVGEVRAVAPLVRALLESGESILFTSFTATGHQEIQRSFAESVTSGVIPIDFYLPCMAFFQRHAIRLGLIMETELWPELLYQAHRKAIPLLLINARLSRKSSDANYFVRGLLATTLAYFSQILTRNERDRTAFANLGVENDRMAMPGNLKSVLDDSPARVRLVERDYLLLASSHDGEELQFLRSRPAGLGRCLVVIAPRHPPRGAAIREQIEQLGLTCVLRSQSGVIDAQTDVYLADTLGELPALMAFARVVIMGGSFDDTGGHNLIEAANLGCATITGPADSNIREDIEMLGDGVIQVGDMDECWREIGDLLQHPERARVLGDRARARLALQPDVIDKYLQAIQAWL